MKKTLSLTFLMILVSLLIDRSVGTLIGLSILVASRFYGLIITERIDGPFSARRNSLYKAKWADTFAYKFLIILVPKMLMLVGSAILMISDWRVFVIGLIYLFFASNPMLGAAVRSANHNAEIVFKSISEHLDSGEPVENVIRKNFTECFDEKYADEAYRLARLIFGEEGLNAYSCNVYIRSLFIMKNIGYRTFVVSDNSADLKNIENSSGFLATLAMFFKKYQLTLNDGVFVRRS